MSPSHGRSYLAIPGPSVIPEAVLQAMHRPSPNIYEGELVDLTDSLIPDLRTVAQTKGHVAMYMGNGHAAWEASLANVCSRGDRVLVLATGRFGHGWAEMAEGLALDVQILEFGLERAVDPAQVEEVLRADTTHSIKAVLAVHVDTSTSILSDVPAIRAAIDAAGHPALLMADCVASLGCDRFEMDAWGVDVMISASQKGLMTPAGLAFVFFNDRAKARPGDLATRYWDWSLRAEPDAFYQYWCGTAATHHIYGLRTALDMMMDEGMPAIWARHERLAQAVWSACEAWGATGPLKLNVAARALRSRAVTAIGIGPGQGDALRHWCEHEAGLTLGIGLGRTPPDAFFRIGHMGYVNAQMILGCLATIQAGLVALDIPHGQGAIDAAARAVTGGSVAAQAADTDIQRRCG